MDVVDTKMGRAIRSVNGERPDEYPPEQSALVEAGEQGWELVGVAGVGTKPERCCTSSARWRRTDEMSDHPRHLTTEDQRERFHLARTAGGMCAACGRALEDGEAVYVEPFTIGTETAGTRAYGSVGAECAAPEQVRYADSAEPERCAGCEGAMYYRVAAARGGDGDVLASVRAARANRISEARRIGAA